MKKIKLYIGLAIAFLGFSTVSVAQGNELVQGAKMSLDKDVHDYGKIKKGADGSCYFTITNIGTEPLTITNAKGSCGCTVPSWPKEPIIPGESAKMKVTYATNRVGPINKSVTITSNSVDGKVKMVKIKGEVLKPAPEDGAPVIKQKSPMLKN
ncbi:MAG: DUF1573 domain-containing protein [Flavobacteriales bacterium]